MGLLALLSSVLFMPLEYHAGDEVSGHHRGVELSHTPQTVTEAD